MTTFTTKATTLLLLSLAISGLAAPTGGRAKEDDSAAAGPLDAGKPAVGRVDKVLKTVKPSKRDSTNDFYRDNYDYAYDTQDVTYDKDASSQYSQETDISRMVSSTFGNTGNFGKRHENVYAGSNYNADSQSSDVAYEASQQSASQDGSSVYSATSGGWYPGGFNNVYSANNYNAESQSSDVKYDASQQSASESGASVYSANGKRDSTHDYYVDHYDYADDTSNTTYDASKNSSYEQDLSIMRTVMNSRRSNKDEVSGINLSLSKGAKRDYSSSLDYSKKVMADAMSSVDYSKQEEHYREREDEIESSSTFTQ